MTGGAGARRAVKRHEPHGPLEVHLRSQEIAVLRGIAASARLTEDIALSFLERRDLPPQVLEDLSHNAAVMRHRKIILAVVAHPRTPRHVTLPITRNLYTFELMQLALTPAIAADIKLVVEEALVARLEAISSGERLTLAKRGSTRIAAALLSDPESRVIEAALNNPFLTEIWVVKSLMREDAPQSLVHAVCRHRTWPLRREVQVALLRNEHTPLARAIAIAGALPVNLLTDVLRYSRLHRNIKSYLTGQLLRRGEGKHARNESAADER